MKKILLLFVVFVFVFGCKKDTIDVEPLPQTPLYGVEMALEKFNVTDTVGLDLNTVVFCSWDDNSISSFSGIKNNKIWITLYESTSKQLIGTWLVKKPSQKGIEKVGLQCVLKIKSNEYIIGSIINFKNEDENDKKAIAFILGDKTSVYSFKGEQIFLNTVKGKDEFWVKTTTKQHPSEVLVSEIRTIKGELFAIDVSKCELDSSILYSGFKEDNKIWFGLYDLKNKTLEEWDSSDTYERKVHIGYGEYKNVKELLSENMDNKYHSDVVKIKQVSGGYLLSVTPLFQGEILNYRNLFILKENKSYTLSFNSTIEDYFSWYKGSYLVLINVGHDFKPFLYSPTGEFINSFLRAPSSKSQPCSYTEFIQYDGESFISRSLLSSYSEIAWLSRIEPLENIPSNTKKAVTLLNHNTNIWEYQVDLTYYDGTKKTVKFSVDIDNGKVTIL